MNNNHNHGDDTDDPQHWKNWISTGDFIQLSVMVVLVVASYVKQGANIEQVREQTQAQGVLLQQLHESVDQLRTQRQMTPEAAVRIASLESKVQDLEVGRATTDGRLQRIEDKIDDLRKELTRR